MSNQFVAEIRIFPTNFAPVGWATCDGQLLSISQNTALFSLVGTFYGGNGQTTFGLPNIQGSGLLHQGQGQGLSQYFLGQTGGSQSVSLITNQMPAHTHTALAKGPGGKADPTGNIWGAAGTQLPPPNFYSSVTPTVPMATNALAPAGGSQPHNNLMPYLTLTFCIALQGIFPARS